MRDTARAGGQTERCVTDTVFSDHICALRDQKVKDLVWGGDLTGEV